MSQEKNQPNKEEVLERVKTNITENTKIADRVQFIAENGDDLNRVNKDTASHQAMIDQLMVGLTDENDKNQVIGALIDCEWNNCKDNNPATFMRLGSLFKLAMEQPMKWRLEDKNNQEQALQMAQQYREDPIKFMQEQYELPDVIKTRFKQAVQAQTVQAQKGGKKYNPGSTMHNLVFSSVNGPMVKHFEQRSKEPGLTEEDRNKRSEEFTDLQENKAFAVTDASRIVMGGYTRSIQNMLERGQYVRGNKDKQKGHQLTDNEINGYVQALDNLLDSIDPSEEKNRIYNNSKDNITDFREQRDEYNQKQASQEARPQEVSPEAATKTAQSPTQEKSEPKGLLSRIGRAVVKGVNQFLEFVGDQIIKGFKAITSGFKGRTKSPATAKGDRNSERLMPLEDPEIQSSQSQSVDSAQSSANISEASMTDEEYMDYTDTKPIDLSRFEPAGEPKSAKPSQPTYSESGYDFQALYGGDRKFIDEEQQLLSDDYGSDPELTDDPDADLDESSSRSFGK